MKATWATTLGLAMGLWAAGAKAGEPDKQPVIPQAPPSVAVPPIVALPTAAHGNDDIWERATGWVTATEATRWPNGSRGMVGQTYLSGEYLLWWLKDSRLPALVTNGGANNLQPGALGQPNTVIRVGGNIDHEEQSGGRFCLGYWLDETQQLGVEANYLFLGRRTVRMDVGSSGSLGSPVVARPYVDIVAGAERADLVAFPQQLAGSVRTSLDNSIWGLEANGRAALGHGAWYRLGGLGGLRYLEMAEGLGVASISTQPPFGAGATALVLDRFGTRNRFFGAQAGLLAQMGWGKLGLDLTSKLALGGVEQTATINGQTVFRQASGTSSFPVGLLAQKTNAGGYSRDQFAVVPELGAQLHLQVSDHLRAYLGYSFVYLSEVARPGDQIDRGLNPSQLPTVTGAGTLVGPARPAFSFQSADFWAQGLSFGMELSF